MASAGKISINLSAGTAQFVVDMEKANAKVREFGAAHKTHAVSGVQATSAALRTLEGGITNNLRAAENFLAKTLKLGDALKVAFPVVGAIAFGGVLFELVKKVGEAYDAFTKLQEAPKRIAQEFNQLAQPIRVANDELAVANDRLSNDIAKLQGKPQNNLSLALHEAALSADKLTENLNRAFEAQQKLLESEAIGGLKAFFTGNEKTSDLAEQFKTFRGGLTDISIGTNDKLDQEKDPTKRKDIYASETEQQKKAARDEITYIREQLKTAESKQRIYNNYDGQALASIDLTGSGNHRAGRPSGAKPADQSARISTLKGELDAVQQVLAGIGLQQTNDVLRRTKEGLESSASNAKIEAPVSDKIKELQARLAGVKLEESSSGTSPLMEAVSKGAAKAIADVAELNKRLEATHRQVTPAEVIKIENLERSIALTEAQKTSHERFAETLKEITRESGELTDKLAGEESKRQDLLSTIREQTAASIELSAAESKGADAVFAAQLKVKLAKIDDPDVRSATQALDTTEHSAEIAKTVNQLNQETAATQRLTAAILGGEQARRQAELSKIRNSGAPADVIAAQLKARKAQYDLQDAEQLKNMPATAGITAYFQQMVDSAQSAAMQIKGVLDGTFQGINDNLSRLITGQKSDWAGFFLSISQEFAKMALLNGETAIAKQLGLGGSSGQAGSSSNSGGGAGGAVAGILGGLFGRNQSAASRSQAAGGTPGFLSDGDAGSSAADEVGSSGGGGFASVIGGFFKSLFGGFKAGGGDVDPGKAYVVGEHGPEVFSPSGRGSITPNNKLSSGGAMYYIDARGANEADVEQRVQRSLVAVHGSAVKSSAAVQAEMAKRRPKGS